MAPSLSSTQNANAPTSRSARLGTANSGPSGVASAPGGSRKWPATRMLTTPAAATVNRCGSTPTPAPATRPPTAAPPSAPNEKAA